MTLVCNYLHFLTNYYINHAFNKANWSLEDRFCLKKELQFTYTVIIENFGGLCCFWFLFFFLLCRSQFSLSSHSECVINHMCVGLANKYQNLKTLNNFLVLCGQFQIAKQPAIVNVFRDQCTGVSA